MSNKKMPKRHRYIFGAGGGNRFARRLSRKVPGNAPYGIPVRFHNHTEK
jgi:hypothetical protein